LGEEVLPYTALPCTSVICEILKAEKKSYKVFDWDDKMVLQATLEDDPSPNKTLEPFLWIKNAELRSQRGPYKRVQVFWPTQVLDVSGDPTPFSAHRVESAL